MCALHPCWRALVITVPWHWKWRNLIFCQFTEKQLCKLFSCYYYITLWSWLMSSTLEIPSGTLLKIHIQQKTEQKKTQKRKALVTSYIFVPFTSRYCAASVEYFIEFSVNTRKYLHLQIASVLLWLSSIRTHWLCRGPCFTRWWAYCGGKFLLFKHLNLTPRPPPPCTLLQFAICKGILNPSSGCLVSHFNKKVLLRERKRHTDCHVASTPSVVLTGRGGLPHPLWGVPGVPTPPPSRLGRGVPHPWPGGT